MQSEAMCFGGTCGLHLQGRGIHFYRRETSVEERVEREDGGGNRDRSCEDGHCSVAVFITEPCQNGDFLLSFREQV